MNQTMNEVTNSKYDWKTFDLLLKGVVCKGEIKIPIEICDTIMEFLRCKLCFIGVDGYAWYEKATHLNKLSVLKAIPSWGYGKCLNTSFVNYLLLIACKSEIHNNLKLVKLLAEEGSNITFNNLELVKYLVEQGADIKMHLRYVLESEDAKTHLHYACMYYLNLDVVKYLVEQGADVNAKDADDDTPLHDACKEGNLDIVKYLVEKGADVNAKNDDDDAPLHYACDGRPLVGERPDIVKYLVEQGADMEAKGKDNNTPLHCACIMKNCIYNLDVVKYLVEQGANIEAKDKDNTTPLHGAWYAENYHVVKYLADQGADTGIEDDEDDISDDDYDDDNDNSDVVEITMKYILKMSQEEVEQLQYQ